MIIKREGRDVAVCNRCGITEDGDLIDLRLVDRAVTVYTFLREFCAVCDKIVKAELEKETGNV